MDKLLNFPTNLDEFEGVVKELKRIGNGRQKLGDFGYFESTFVDDIPTGLTTFYPNNFPFVYSAIRVGQIETDQSIVFNETLTFEGKIGPNMNLVKGVLKTSDSLEVHFVVMKGKIEEFEVFRNSKQLKKEDVVVRQCIVYPTKESIFPVFKLNLTNGIVTFGRYIDATIENDEFLEIDLLKGTYSVKCFEAGRAFGKQLVLDFSTDVPTLRIFELVDGVTENSEIRFCDGRVIEHSGDIGILKVCGWNSNIIGPMNFNRIEGPCKFKVDDRLQINCDIQKEVLRFNECIPLFNSVERFDHKENRSLLNGHHHVCLEENLFYKGYFLNDFIYCHKDAFSIAMTHKNSEKTVDFIEFCKSVTSFDGKIVEGKAHGRCKVKYSDGSLFTGYLNEDFLRSGQGMQVEPSGKMYVGPFEKDLYQGFGKLVDADQVIFGLFEKGKLKIDFNIDNIDVELVKNLQILLPSIQDKISFEEIKEYAKENNLDFRNIKEVEKVQKQIMKAAKEGLKGLGVERINEELFRQKGNKEKNELVVESLFKFKNGYFYHGHTFEDFIVDKDEGWLITPLGEKIKCKYNAIHDLRLGAFKSKKGNLFFMFNYDQKVLGEVEMN